MAKNTSSRNKILLWWIASLAGAFILLSLVYFVAQYVIVARTNAPRIQQADDIAWKIALQLEKNGKIEPINSQVTQNEGSTTTQVVVYSKDGIVLDALGVEIDKLPLLPEGILDSTDEGEKNIFSWQPEGYTRSDYVIVSAGKYGYVLVSLDSVEIDNSLNKLFYILLIVYILLSVAITTAAIVQHKKSIS